VTDLSETTSVVENLLQTKNTRDRHLFGPGHKRVLAFDGGGVRGAISVAFLERIEAIFKKHQCRLLTGYIAEKERAGVADENLAAARKKLEASREDESIALLFVQRAESQIAHYDGSASTPDTRTAADPGAVADVLSESPLPASNARIARVGAS